MHRKSSLAVDEDTTFSCPRKAHDGLLPGMDLSWVLEDGKEPKSTGTTYSHFTPYLPSKPRKTLNVTIDRDPTAEKLANVEGERYVAGVVGPCDLAGQAI